MDHQGLTNACTTKVPTRLWDNARLFITIFCALDGMDETLGNQGDNAITLSKSQHQFMPVGEDEGLRSLHRQCFWCCRPCSNGNYAECETRAEIGDARCTKMLAKAAASETRTAGADALTKHNNLVCALKAHDFAVVRIGKEDASKPEETFFLCRTTKSAQP